MDNIKINQAYKLISKLDTGAETIVTVQTQTNSRGEAVRVWTVEFQQQSITLSFMYESNESVERAYAEFLAYGPKLFSYLFNEAIVLEQRKRDLTDAFSITFNDLMLDKHDLEAQIAQYETDEEDDKPTEPDNLEDEGGDLIE